MTCIDVTVYVCNKAKFSHATSKEPTLAKNLLFVMWPAPTYEEVCSGIFLVSYNVSQICFTSNMDIEYSPVLDV